MNVPWSVLHLELTSRECYLEGHGQFGFEEEKVERGKFTQVSIVMFIDLESFVTVGQVLLDDREVGLNVTE